MSLAAFSTPTSATRSRHGPMAGIPAATQASMACGRVSFLVVALFSESLE